MIRSIEITSSTGRFAADYPELIELTRRVGKMATELELLKAAALPASHGDPAHYDLAASDEHVPGEDDRD